MQDQEQRDQKSVTIFTALVLCALMTVAGLALIWAADELFGIRDDVGDGLRGATQLSAFVAAIVYVYRHRRP